MNRSKRPTSSMLVFRFMSEAEFRLFNQGLVIEGRRQDPARLTDVSGKPAVCFMPADGPLADAREDARFAYSYLSGVVSDDVCAIFKTDSEGTRGQGRYADPHGSFFDTIWVDELYFASYSRETHRLVAHCETLLSGSDERWDWRGAARLEPPE